MSEQFINWAEKKLGGSILVTKEAYGDQSQVFKLDVLDKRYFLKIGVNLEKELVRLKWLKGKLPIPEVIDFTKIGDKDALLLTAIEGNNLAVLKKKWPAEKVVDNLANALRQFHTVNIEECPFVELSDSNSVLVHGDACLPNFIFKDDNFSGYIDLGDMTVGNPEVDFAAAIWSLQYNLGQGYGAMFLKKYGMEDATKELAEKLRLQYEDMQQKWGL
ncbi:MAG: phosphotransferase [Candidatus Moranbacteria bacterium]|nr:phosphotransferase [Candidatus Moranbacteria bacterium]